MRGTTSIPVELWNAAVTLATRSNISVSEALRRLQAEKVSVVLLPVEKTSDRPAVAGLLPPPAKPKRLRPRQPRPVRPPAPDRVSFRIEVRVPGYNQLSKVAVKKSSAIRKLWRQLVREAVDKAGIGSFDTPVRFRFCYVEPNRQRDPDNIDSGGRKVILDGLQHAGVIPGDGWSVNAGMSSPHFEVGPASVTVTIRRASHLKGNRWQSPKRRQPRSPKKT